MREISNSLLQARKSKHLTQLQVAEKVGVSRQAISKWESGAAVPSTENLIALSQIYEISLDSFAKDMCHADEAKQTAGTGLPEQPTAKHEPKHHAARWICVAFIIALFVAIGFTLGSRWAEHENRIIDMSKLTGESCNDAEVGDFSLEFS